MLKVWFFGSFESVSEAESRELKYKSNGSNRSIQILLKVQVFKTIDDI